MVARNGVTSLRMLQGTMAPEILELYSPRAHAWSLRRLSAVRQTIPRLSQILGGSCCSDALALGAAVLLLQGYRAPFVTDTIAILHAGLTTLYTIDAYDTLADWNPDVAVQVSFGTCGDENLRNLFWRRYCSSTRAVKLWWTVQSIEQQHRYRSFLLPDLQRRWFPGSLRDHWMDALLGLHPNLGHRPISESLNHREGAPW